MFLKNETVFLSDPCYIADHILRIERRYKDKYPKGVLDSLWRIADSANLFPGELENYLTDEQEKITWEFVTEFKQSSTGKAALKKAEKFTRWKAIA